MASAEQVAMTVSHQNTIKEVKEMRRIECSGLFLIIFAVCLSLLAFPGAGLAQQGKPIELSYGTPFGIDNSSSKIDAVWIAKIEKETKGRVKIKPYWGGSVTGGRDAVTDLQQGVVDIAFLNVLTSKSGFPITKAMFNFFSGATESVGGRVFKQLLKDFPQIEGDYKGMKVLCWGGGTEQLLTKKPVRTVADLKGMRIRALGDQIGYLKALGAEGIATPSSEVYLNLQKNILDGSIVPMHIVEDMKFTEVAKYVTLINAYRPHVGMRMMNLNTWNKLPADIRKVFEDNIEWFTQTLAADTARADEHGTEFAKSQGVTFLTMSKEEMEKLYTPIRAQGEQAAKELDKQGLPGTKILNEAQQLIKQYSSK